MISQFLIESLFPLLAGALVFFSLASWHLHLESSVGTYALLVFLGGILGWLSGFFVPSPFGNFPAVQAVVVLLIPVVASFVLGRYLVKNVRGCFWSIYCFSFSLLLFRSIAIHNSKISFLFG